MGSGRSIQEVLPRFFQGSPKRVSYSARQVPGSSQAAPGSSRKVFRGVPVPFRESLRSLSGGILGSSQANHESHIKNGHHESHIKHDHPLACDLWDCYNLVLLSSCLAMSFLSKRFIQTFPPSVPVDVSFLLLHLFRALHEGTLLCT